MFKSVLAQVSVMLLFTASSAVAATDGADFTRTVYDAVDSTRLMQLLNDMSGGNEVTVDGKTFRINERISMKGKAKFRAYFINYFKNLGMQINLQDYPTKHVRLINDDHLGHNVEAVLPGQSKDWIIVIVHYDSMGNFLWSRKNSAVDDDMSGMSIMLESARILTQYRGHLKYTVRFVAVDYEEWIFPRLEGARHYAQYIKDLSLKEGFKIVSAVDDEESGWNCQSENKCGDKTGGKAFDINSCSPDHKYSHALLGQRATHLALSLSSLEPVQGCVGENSDHYALWEIGVPTLEIQEHTANNHHIDYHGSDTIETIDPDYFAAIARVTAAITAEMVEFVQ